MPKKKIEYAGRLCNLKAEQGYPNAFVVLDCCINCEFCEKAKLYYGKEGLQVISCKKDTPLNLLWDAIFNRHWFSVKPKIIVKTEDE